ncbi:putative ribonuclease [Cucumis melo var. makuwa]|uniref:Putative ribonuclease n=1 Tax=Cucumis melo var. makuwa TaxID=1194695 RepID=A0A5D3DZW3_CUCMM|nr:putative ribonuclease [Cucumis melo var. makuwa]
MPKTQPTYQKLTNDRWGKDRKRLGGLKGLGNSAGRKESARLGGRNRLGLEAGVGSAYGRRRGSTGRLQLTRACGSRGRAAHAGDAGAARVRLDTERSGSGRGEETDAAQLGFDDRCAACNGVADRAAGDAAELVAASGGRIGLAAGERRVSFRSAKSGDWRCGFDERLAQDDRLGRRRTLDGRLRRTVALETTARRPAVREKGGGGNLELGFFFSFLVKMMVVH